MKAYEVLLLAKPALEKLADVGVSPKDIQHLEMFNDYLNLKSEGHKVAYIEAYLCDQYNISERRFYQVIKNMCKDL